MEEQAIPGNENTINLKTHCVWHMYLWKGTVYEEKRDSGIDTVA